MGSMKEMKCEDCLARGYWEGKHDCPPFLKFLVALKKADGKTVTEALEVTEENGTSPLTD